MLEVRPSSNMSPFTLACPLSTGGGGYLPPKRTVRLSCVPKMWNLSLPFCQKRGSILHLWDKIEESMLYLLRHNVPYRCHDVTPLSKWRHPSLHCLILASWKWSISRSSVCLVVCLGSCTKYFHLITWLTLYWLERVWWYSTLTFWPQSHTAFIKSPGKEMSLIYGKKMCSI